VPTSDFNIGGTVKQLLVPVVLALLATGCTATPNPPTAGTPAASQDASTQVAPTPTVPRAGEFTLDAQSGGKITFKLPTPETDPALAELEAFRKKAGGKPVSYIVADVDNRNGTEPVNLYQIKAFDKEGTEYTFGAVTDLLETWKPTYRNDYEYKLADGRVVDHATGSGLSREATEMHKSILMGADVAERAKIILATADVDLPDGFARVSVQPPGAGEGKDAVPVQG
jgi:hypothetical protein